MEMQIKSGLWQMELPMLHDGNRLPHAEDPHHLGKFAKTQEGNLKASLRFLLFTGLLKRKVNMGHFRVWPSVTADIRLTHGDEIARNVKHATFNLLPQPARSRGSERAKEHAGERGFMVSECGAVVVAGTC